MNPIDYFSIHIVPRMFRGKGMVNPIKTGIVTERVRCIKQYDVNIFFYTRNGTTIAIDAGYKNHPNLKSDMERIKICSDNVSAMFLTHVDPDHAGGVDNRSINLFPQTQIYVGKTEAKYLTNEFTRKKIAFFKFKNSIRINKGYIELEDMQSVNIAGIRVQAILIPGHTLGHLCYMVDDEYLFVGDSLALNEQGGYCFFDFFNVDSVMNIRSLQKLKSIVIPMDIKYVFTAHNGCTQDVNKAFANISQMPDYKQKNFVFDATAPFDAFVEE